MAICVHSNEYEFKDLTLWLNGAKITTIEEVNFWKNVDKNFVYGEDAYPHAIIQGRHTYGGDMTIRQSSFELLNTAVLADTLDIDTFAIVAIFNNNHNTTTYLASNVAFTDWSLNHSNTSTYAQITIPFIAQNITIVRKLR